MGANLTIYCLEELTDYSQFERLCHDLMVLEGYPKIEPLGGSKDKGRDAISIDTSGRTTIFAYSVREDWRAKLSEDAGKITKHGHVCDTMVFLSTSRITAHEKDEAKNSIKRDHGFDLEIFEVERFRILLETKHPQIKLNHPHIFPPDFLTPQKGLGLGPSKNQFVTILFAAEDIAFSEWIARRLTYEGYFVWSPSLPNFPDLPPDFELAIREYSFFELCVISDSLVRNVEFGFTLANVANLVKDRTYNSQLMLRTGNEGADQLPSKLKSLMSFDFCENWATGLTKVLEYLQRSTCPRQEKGASEFVADGNSSLNYVTNEKEQVFSNCLKVEKLPERIYGFRLDDKFNAIKLNDLEFKWAFRSISSTLFVSFEDPPEDVSRKMPKFKRIAYLWKKLDSIEGIDPTRLVSELVKKSLIVDCQRKGLKYCPETHVHYFSPTTTGNTRPTFTNPITGKKSNSGVFGKRKYKRPGFEEEFLYFLAPRFFLRQNVFSELTIFITIQVRITDLLENIASTKTTVSRRKFLCKNWWNDDWGNKILAIIQFLSDSGKIRIGNRDNQLIIDGSPIIVEVPFKINEGKMGDLTERDLITEDYYGEDNYIQ